MGMRMDLKEDWRFFRGNLAPERDTDGWGGAKARAYDFGATSESLNDAGWRRVSLPHDFVLEGDFTRKAAEGNEMQHIPEMESVDSRHMAGGFLEGDVAWYRRHFTLPEEWRGKRVLLHFDGVYRDSTVYVNQYYVGEYENGYTSFYYDITDFLYDEDGRENLIAVRVDATGREGWWYEGGGIYRDVWVEGKEAVSFSPDGVYVNSVVDCNQKTARLEIRTEVESKYLQDADIRVECIVRDAKGNEVQRIEQAARVDAWSQTEVRLDTGLTDVTLWDLEHPALYELEARLFVEEKGEENSAHRSILSDNSWVNFGLRSIEFTPDNGMLLNGRKVPVRGLCCHHDHGGVGIAVPRSVQEYRLRQMKSMGANAYRCAHYQPTRELLDICDRIGLLVLAESRRMSSAPRDIEQLKALVKRDRNHPCIFLWGIGNEEIFCQDRKECAKTTITLRSEVRKLDPSRPITSAVVCWNGKERFSHARAYLPVTKELDVMGFNYCMTAWDDYHEQMPNQPILITEASANSWTRGCYCTEEEKGQYYVYDPDNESKCRSGKKAARRDLGENDWKAFAARPYLAGIFLWAGMDYRGEPTPLSYPAVSTQFGIFDLCGFAKDNYYYYKSWWTEEPVLHLFPHWNHKGWEGKPLEVFCYSNLDEVELLVNGRSYGRKKMERNGYLSWESVIYEPGTLTARGYRGENMVLTENVETTSEAFAIQLTPYKEALAEYDDAAIVQVSVVDSAGRVVPDADEEISFTVEGAGSFLGTANGNPGSHEADTVPYRRAFHGRCQLLVRVEGDGDTIRIRARSAGLSQAECTLSRLS